MTERYIRNIPAISAEEQDLLKSKSVIVIGCGGLGGYAIEYLARLGVGHITAVDGDVFCESNLNRQLLSSTETLGQPKATAAVARIHTINPEVEAIAVNVFLTADRASELVSKVDVVIDALDNVESRLILEDVCEKVNIPIIHGAVQGWNLQATVVLPGSRVLHNLYKADSKANSSESIAHESPNTSLESKACLCPTPACCAAIQVSEALKILLGRESALNGNMLFMDLLTMENYSISMI